MDLTSIQYLIIGIIQGITEWLPISSSGIITLFMSNFYGITDVSQLLHSILLLHLGTFFAALIYLREDFVKLLRTLFYYKKSKPVEKKIFNFILISSIITAIIGLAIFYFINESQLNLAGRTINLVVGFFLLFTGIMQLKPNIKGLKKEKDLGKNDGILIGLLQGLSSIPGISRSGITVSGLLLRKFDDTSALRLSFLMSLPVVLFGNIVFNLKDIIFDSNAIYGLLASFVFGLLTINGLMKLSRKINFGWFVLIFAVLMILSVFI